MNGRRIKFNFYDTSALRLKTSPPRVIGSVVEFDCVEATTIDTGVLVVGTVIEFSSNNGWLSIVMDDVEAIIGGTVIEGTVIG